MGFLLVSIALLLGLNIKATLAILHDDFPEPMQRNLQLLLVWLLPLMGALLLLAIHRKSERPSRKYREYPDPPDGFISRNGQRQDKFPDLLDGD
ncbi:MAG: hypothetical protein V4805_06180 [Pseudomonadota bacterium]